MLSTKLFFFNAVGISVCLQCLERSLTPLSKVLVIGPRFLCADGHDLIKELGKASRRKAAIEQRSLYLPLQLIPRSSWNVIPIRQKHSRLEDAAKQGSNLENVSCEDHKTFVIHEQTRLIVVWSAHLALPSVQESVARQQHANSAKPDKTSK